MTEKLWDALTTVIRMNDKVMSVATRLDTQQQKIEDLTARVIRLETALEFALASKVRRSSLGRKQDPEDPKRGDAAFGRERARGRQPRRCWTCRR